MLRLFLRPRKAAIIALQALLIVATYYAAFALRLDFFLDARSRSVFLLSLPWVLLIKLVVFGRFGLLRGWWRYAGMSDLVDITKASVSSAFLVYLVFWLGLWPRPGYPRSVVLIDLVLTIFCMGGARFLVRAYTETVHTCVARKETLIVGAGVAGTTIMRELKQNPDLDYKPIGFVDDDVTKLGIKIHGKRVLGTTNDIGALVEEYEIKCVLIAMPSAKEEKIDEIISKCSQLSVELKILNGVGKRIAGVSHIDQMRQVRRKALGAGHVANSAAKVLVVGGAGYIGGAVTELLLAEQTPFSVYDSLLYEPHYLKSLDFIRGDVRDAAKLGSLIKDYTHVIWLAAIVGDGACEVNPELTVEVNQKAVEWLATNYHGRIFFASTCSVYGQEEEEVTEESRLCPLSLYAKTKAAAEVFLRDKNSLVFRLGTAFGVSDTHSRPRMDLAVNYMTANALTKGELSVFGGTQWRPLVHVKDIAQAIVHNLDRPVHGVYNLAAHNMQIKDLAAIISRMTRCRVNFTEQKFQDERNYHVSTQKALRDGIFNPEAMRTLEDGVREISEVVALGRIKQTENEMYFNVRYAQKLHAFGQLI